MTFIGIDPGLGGGIAVIHQDVGHVDVYKMPQTERDLLDLLESVGPKRHPARAMLEKVHSMPSQGHVGAFTFGKGYGALRMALTAAFVPFDEVRPAVWQKALGCLTKGDKNISKRRAQALFPHVRLTHATADALLIAEYGRRLETRT